MRGLKNYCLSFSLLVSGVFHTHCQEKAGGRSTSGSNIPGAGGTNEVDEEEPIDNGKGTATAIEFQTLPTTTLFTKVAAENTCVPFVVKALNGTAIAADVPITLETQVSVGMLDAGSITPASGVTDAAGELNAIYCSGENEGKLIILAKFGNISVNSAKITVSNKPVYKFVYVRSDADPMLTPSDNKDAGGGVVYLNLLDSGPQDCTNIYFKLTRSSVPVVGEKLTFTTQPDFPKGAKLGKRTDTLQTRTEAVTNKKYSYIEAISSGAGEFAVPVCAGVSLGTLLISSTYTDEEERDYTVKSPVIRITAGLTNYINMSLTFDPNNARTMKGFFNNNSSYELPVSVQLGARYDGNPITEYPVGIATEVGRVRISNGGIPTSDTGSVNFTLQSLHLVDNYPYQVTPYAGYPQAQTRCEPQSVALWGAGQGLSEVKYTDLKKNWRSTMVYSIRGQEHYHDANRNGVYDVGGDGFWDKNQNGIYDAGDTLTYDAGADGLFSTTSEWFIDLPTPFVDVDEDGVYTATKDLLIGDEYLAPNGQRDADAQLWKYEYFPVSMGPSLYGLQRYRVQTASVTNVDNPVTMPWGTSYQVFGINAINDASIWGAASASLGVYRTTIFAHDLCGNLLPGGTKMSLSFVASYAPTYGARAPSGHFYSQPGDQYLEPSRHLLRDASGATGTLNFNAIDHAVHAVGYPVVSSIEIPPCVNVCTGDVATAGVACDGWAGYAYMTVTEPELDQQKSAATVTFSNPLSYSSIATCTCGTGAPPPVAGVCTCPTGTTLTGGACL